jgi:hypothetical protein
VSKKTQIFIFCNLVLVIIVGAVLFLPIWDSLTRGRENVQILERQHAAERSYEFGQNLYFPRQIKHYSEMISALADVSALAGYFNLRTVEFSTSQAIVAGEADFSRLYEKQVRAEYEGTLHDLADFLYNLYGVFVRSFSLENTRLSLDFSVFGSD